MGVYAQDRELELGGKGRRIFPGGGGGGGGYGVLAALEDTFGLGGFCRRSRRVLHNYMVVPRGVGRQARYDGSFFHRAIDRGYNRKSMRAM